jgi:hypothetical protein
MTQTLIEKLEALPRKRLEDRPANPLQMIHDLQKHGLNMPLRGREYIDFADLRAIIEDAKAEKQEPAAYTMESQLDVECYNCGIMWPAHCNIPETATVALYRSPQPDIVAELVKALDGVIGADKFCAEPTVSDEHVQAKTDAHEQAYSYAAEVLAKAKESRQGNES